MLAKHFGFRFFLWLGWMLICMASATVGSAALADSASTPHRAPRVPWLTDTTWPTVCLEANTTDQPILIDFTATWCGPCKLLDVMVFTEPEVIRELNTVVTLQVDIDRPEYQALKEKFGIEVVPTVIWCDRQGVEVDRFTGYISSAQFLDTVRQWRQNRSLDMVLRARLAEAPQNPRVLLDLARRQAERGHDRQAEVLYRRLMNHRLMNHRLMNHRHGKTLRLVARGMLGLADLENRQLRPRQARYLAREVASMYSRPGAASQGRSEVMLEAALFQEAIDDTAGMLDTFRALARLEDRNALALHGYARAAVRTGRDLVPATRSALRAVVYSNNDPEVINTVAACYYGRGLYGRAIRWQKKAVSAAPDRRTYQQKLQKYEAARAADPYGLRARP